MTMDNTRTTTIEAAARGLALRREAWLRLHQIDSGLSIEEFAARWVLEVGPIVEERKLDGGWIIRQDLRLVPR